MRSQGRALWPVAAIVILLAVSGAALGQPDRTAGLALPHAPRTGLPSAPQVSPTLKAVRAPGDLPASLAGMNGVEPFYAASNAAIDAQAQELENAGVTWVRTEFIQSGGAVQWSTYDYWVLTSAPAHHLKVLALLDYSTVPDDITHVNAPLTGAGNFNPYIVDFSNAATAISQHYGTAISAYEIYNEENSNYWIWSASNGSMTQVWPEQYGKLLTQTYMDIHAQDPSAIVMVGGLLPPGPDPTSSDPTNNQSVGDYLNLTYGSSTFAWYRANYGNANPVDAIALHPYVDASTQMPELFDHVRYTLEPWQPGVPFWVTEFGWTASASGGYGSSGEVEQATNLTEAYTYLDARGDVTAALWFDWADFAGNPYGVGGMASNGSLTYWKSSWAAYYDLWHHDGATPLAILAPSTVTPGASFSVNVSVTNSGTSTWSEQGLWVGLPGEVRLGSTSSNAFVLANGRCGGYSNSATDQRLFTCGEVPPAGVAYYDATATAPTTPGTYTLGFQMVHDGVQWFGSAISLTVTVRTSPPAPTTYALTGSVVSSTGAGVVGARVAVAGNSNATLSTGAGGVFTLNVPNGTYSVGAADGGYGYGSTSATVNGGPTSASLVLTSLNGSLQLAVVLPNLKPLAGASVSVDGGASVLTPSNGTLDLYLVDGVHALAVFDRGYLSEHSNATVVGGVVTPDTVQLPPTPGTSTYAVDLTVLNRSNGAPVPGASVTMNGTYQGTTDSSGHLLSPHAWANGTYPLRVSALGFQENNTTVVVLGTTYSTIVLNSTYSPPPAPGILRGAYFPATATFEVDQVVVHGVGVNAQGGEVLYLNLSQGTHYFRLSNASGSTTGSFGIESGYVTWEHLTLRNSTGGGGPTGGSSSPWSSLSGMGLVELAVGIGIGVLAVGVVVLLLTRRRPPRRGASGRSREEGLSPSEGSGPHGLPDGDPPPAAGAGDPGT